MTATNSSPTRTVLLGVAMLAMQVGIAIVLAEWLLQPTGTDRATLVLVLATPAIVAAFVVPALRKWVSKRSSVASAALAVAFCSLAIGAVSSSIASRSMFLTKHDYRLFLIVLGLSFGIALILGKVLLQPVSTALRRLGDVAGTVANGDLSVRTGIVRNDEVGRAASALDDLVRRLGEAEVDRTNRNRDRQMMLSSVGHDLRTPLAAARAAVEAVRDGLAPNNDEYLALAERHIMSANALLDQLTEYVRVEGRSKSIIRETVSLAELADDVVETFQPLVEKSNTTIQVSTTGPGLVDCSPHELSRVIRNLLDNAIRHSPSGETIDVSITETSSSVMFRCVDRGPGFPADFRAQAFEPFTQADEARSQPGTSGLGLVIAKAIVKAHDGTIELGPGPGGDVAFWLPRHESS